MGNQASEEADDVGIISGSTVVPYLEMMASMRVTKLASGVAI